MDGWMDRRTQGSVAVGMDGHKDSQKGGWLAGWTDGLMQGSIAVGMDGQTGDLVDRLTVIEGPVA